MTRRGGWTLIELLIVVTVMVTVGGVVLTVASTLRDEERLSAACASDLTDLRQAVQLLETDLRTARGPGDLAWRLEAETLRRGDDVVARNIARFEAIWQDDLVTVSLALGRRSDAPHRREAELTFCVHRRVAGTDDR